jgi:hypothetical protein
MRSLAVNLRACSRKKQAAERRFSAREAGHHSASGAWQSMREGQFSVQASVGMITRLVLEPQCIQFIEARGLPTTRDKVATYVCTIIVCHDRI